MLIVERVAALHRVELFANVPGRTLAAVARHASEAVVDSGTTFIAEGAIEDHLFVVVDGRVRVHQGEHTLVELGAGATVGELAALVPEPRSASATALERTTLLRLDKPVLDELLAERPELAGYIITALVARLRAWRADGPAATADIVPT
jgi:CRP-like cAMP-binding protein